MRSTTKPAFVSALTTSLPPMTGRPLMSGGDGHPPNFGQRIGGDQQAVIAPVIENGSYRLFGICQGQLFGLALGDDFRQSRNENGEAAALLGLENDGKAVIFSHARRSLAGHSRGVGARAS